MFVPRLQVPGTQQGVPAWIVEPRPELVTQWCEQLPLANPTASLDDISQYLVQLNRAELPLRKRFAVLEVLVAVAAKLVPLVRREYSDAQLPLGERKLQRHQLVQKTWQELAYGYKTVLMDLILTEKEVLDPKEVLIPAILQCVRILSERLVENYTIYVPDPPGVWLELHQLFHYANSHSIDTIAPRSDGATIGQYYRRPLLLALADPYHLLPGEAAKLYAELDQWAALCKLVRLSPGPVTAETFYVDIHHDCGPHFLGADTCATPPHEARAVDLTEVAAALRKRIADATSPRVAGPQAAPSTLQQRLRRELYLRLAQAWTARGARQYSRSAASEHHLVLTAGLSAAHHFVSGEKPFVPERHEMRLGPKRAPTTLALQPGPQTPASGTLVRGEPPKSTTQPATRGVDPDDAWKPIYTPIPMGPLDYHHPEVDHPYTLCAVTDMSQGGLALSYSPLGNEVRTRVGDVIALQDTGPVESPAPDKPWRIGTVRWLRASVAGLDLGVAILGESALPVGTRAVEGVGKGSEYMRGLVIPAHDVAAAEATLIASPAIYDAGTVLVVTTETAAFHVRLLRLIEGSGSYARFSYRVLDSLVGEEST